MKMKWILLIALSILCFSPVQGRRGEIASKTEKGALYLYRAGYLFSSSVFLQKHLQMGRMITSSLEQILLEIILKGGTLPFELLDENSLIAQAKNSPSISFILGLRFFRQDRFAKSAKFFRLVPSSHTLAAEKYFFMGASMGIRGRNKKAHRFYKRCQKKALKRENREDNEDEKRYFALLKETCQIHIARLFYEQKKYRRSIDQFNTIPKNSYLWPYTLLEKAWGYYQLKDYNRTLGLLATYQAPLLRDYFLPEANLLRALSYHRMCFWKDTAKITRKNRVQFKKTQRLANTLIENKHSHTYFFKSIVKSFKSRKKDRSRSLASTKRPSLAKGVMLRTRKKS